MKLFSRAIATVLCIGLLSGCGISKDDLDKAWEDGYDEGFDEGIMFCEYLEEDDDEDNDDGYENGYDDGYNDGYQAGATYVCLYYGDVDRAFQCAKKGSAWYTFIDAYDQYISNIYDDDETRSKLFWSLVSAKSGDGLTTEEKDLLISTFGKSLFARNGITLD